MYIVVVLFVIRNVCFENFVRFVCFFILVVEECYKGFNFLLVEIGSIVYVFFENIFKIMSLN